MCEKQLFVDKKLCKGHDRGRCVRLAPDAFDNEGDYPEVVDCKELTEEMLEKLIENCPANAIKVKKE